MDTPVDITRFQILAIISSLSMLLFILELVRRGKLREKYALLWLAASTVICLLSIFRDALDTSAHLLGVAYPPAFLFMVAICFGMMILLHFSIVISSLTDKIKTLAQEIAILKNQADKTNPK